MSGLAGARSSPDLFGVRTPRPHLLALVALAACFPYVPTSAPAVQAGEKVVVAHENGFVLRQPARDGARIAPGCRVMSVEGTTGPQAVDTLWFASVMRREATVETADCVFPARAYVVLRDAPPLTPRVREFDGGRTLMLVLALPTLIGVLTGVFTP